MRETMLAPFETSFADALLNADQPIPGGISAHNAAVPARRFAVYRNNVVMGLGKALKNRFPVVEKIVGEEFFAAMARVFALKQPPRSPLLATYGDEFAAFIATFEPARELPYLADVARLEAARTHSYHAADAAPIDASQLATLDTCDVGSIRIDMHPSVGIVRSPYPIVAIVVSLPAGAAILPALRRPDCARRKQPFRILGLARPRPPKCKPAARSHEKHPA